MRLLIRASPIVLTALFVPFLVEAQPAGSLRVAVKDSSGAGIAASGSVKSLATGITERFVTDTGGITVLNDLSVGRYEVHAMKEGFAAQSRVVSVEPGTQAVVEFTLPVGSLAFAVDVAGTTPLTGAGLTLDEIAAPVQTASSESIEQSNAIDLSAFLNRRFGGVFLNEIQGNPMQPDLNYRGYSASPLLGTPQGLSVYMDGVRMNQPFGDVVSWDLIPRIVISEATLMPGSNPLFGLNTLGGAVALQTKDGQTHPGTMLQLNGGSFARKNAVLEHGGSNDKGLNWYTAANLFFEDGWRNDSPSNVRQFFGRLGWQKEKTVLGWSAGYINNALLGNGLQERRFLDRDYASVYTKPDKTANIAPSSTLTVRHAATSNLSFSGNAYYRFIQTKTFNGDINEESLDQSLYQPNAEEQAALAAAGYTGFPVSGENASNTPFPYWRCIAQSLLNEEPAEKCNGLLNRGQTKQHNYGGSGQVNWFSLPGGQRNQFTAGFAYDRGNLAFSQMAQLGYLNPDRSVTGVNSFADGVHGGEEDGEPYDTRVNLTGTVQTVSLYGTDTVSVADQWTLTFSGRYNRTVIDNRDRINPGGGPTSLDGHHVFQRFNPSVGAVFRPGGIFSAYASYSEGSRAPTSIELGCANPEQPCKLPNAMAGDPPLNQVVTRTVEAGLRGNLERRLNWSAGWFFTDNRNDILFVSSEQTGFGYFRNFGKTRREGLQVDLRSRLRRVTIGGNYTFLNATFRSNEMVNGESNSTNEEALEGEPGMEGAIQIQPGNQIPLIPQHMVKAYADVQLTSRLVVDVDLFGFSSAYARGNENNLHQPDGVYYLDSGKSPGYAVVNLGARYQLFRQVELFAQINNLFNRRYYSAGQLGPTGFTDNGSFIARPFPPVDGEYPTRHATFFAPGAPRGIWGGMRLRF